MADDGDGSRPHKSPRALQLQAGALRHSLFHTDQIPADLVVVGSFKAHNVEQLGPGPRPAGTITVGGASSVLTVGLLVERRQRKGRFRIFSLKDSQRVVAADIDAPSGPRILTFEVDDISDILSETVLVYSIDAPGLPPKRGRRPPVGETMLIYDDRVGMVRRLHADELQAALSARPSSPSSAVPPASVLRARPRTTSDLSSDPLGRLPAPSTARPISPPCSGVPAADLRARPRSTTDISLTAAVSLPAAAGPMRARLPLVTIKSSVSTLLLLVIIGLSATGGPSILVPRKTMSAFGAVAPDGSRDDFVGSAVSWLRSAKGLFGGIDVARRCVLAGDTRASGGRIVVIAAAVCDLGSAGTLRLETDLGAVFSTLASLAPTPLYAPAAMALATIASFRPPHAALDLRVSVGAKPSAMLAWRQSADPEQAAKSDYWSAFIIDMERQGNAALRSRLLSVEGPDKDYYLGWADRFPDVSHTQIPASIVAASRCAFAPKLRDEPFRYRFTADRTTPLARRFAAAPDELLSDVHRRHRSARRFAPLARLPAQISG